MSDDNLLLFAVKTVSICGLIYIIVKVITQRIDRHSHEVLEKRLSLELKYESFNNDVLLHIIEGSQSKRIERLAALQVAKGRLNDPNIHKAITNLSFSNSNPILKNVANTILDEEVTDVKDA
ncbi:MAG: hypothetical protein EOM20_11150 [Spartobacteria bacterium]|nr:hypothetical protein [Spartobacteria bacterium]